MKIQVINLNTSLAMTESRGGVKPLLLAYLSEQSVVLHNPVDGIKRPKSQRREGTTPALSTVLQE